MPGTGSICSYQCDNEGNYNITIQVGGFFRNHQPVYFLRIAIKLKHSLHDLGCAGDQPDLREAAGELAERTMEHIGGRVTEMMVYNG